MHFPCPKRGKLEFPKQNADHDFVVRNAEHFVHQQQIAAKPNLRRVVWAEALVPEQPKLEYIGQEESRSTEQCLG